MPPVELPVCRHRGAELRPGRYRCHSPKLRVSPAGVTPKLCASCYCRDHEPTDAPPARRAARCEFLLDAVIDRRGSTCAASWTYGCDVYGECSPTRNYPGVRNCPGCPVRTPEGSDPDVLLVTQRSTLGDALALGAVVESLHRSHPGRYLTALDTAAPALWEHSPRVVPLDRLARITDTPRVLRADRPAVRGSGGGSGAFPQACREHLEGQLGVRIPPSVDRPALRLSDEERGRTPPVQELTGRSIPYWLVDAGCDEDSPGGGWDAATYQEVVDRLRGVVLFVQVGEAGRAHPPLYGGIDLRGQADVRLLMRLAWHAAGGVGSTTSLRYLLAAFGKPHVATGGRGLAVQTAGLTPGPEGTTGRPADPVSPADVSAAVLSHATPPAGGRPPGRAPRAGGG